MKTNIICLIAIVFFAAITTSCRKGTNDFVYTEPSPASLTINDNGKTSYVYTQQNVDISLPNLPPNYQYDPIKYDGLILRFDSHTQQLGAASTIVDVYHFIAIKEGTTTISFTATYNGNTINVFTGIVKVSQPSDGKNY